MELNNVKLDWNGILDKQINKLEEKYPENNIRQAYSQIISLLNENKIKSRVITNGKSVICYSFMIDYSGFIDRLYAVLGFEDESYVDAARAENLLTWIESEARKEDKSVVIGDIYNGTETISNLLGEHGFFKMERIRLELGLKDYFPTHAENFSREFNEIFSVTPASYSDAQFDAYSGEDDVLLFPSTRNERIPSTARILEGEIGKLIPEASFVLKEGEKIIAGIISVETENKNGSSRRALIADIFVDKNNRKKGLGKEILSKSLDKLKEMNFDSVILWVSLNNPARFLYFNLGFRETGYGREISYFQIKK
ncbi:MAG: GNAT family N-acetyltransferase [Thermoplasmatales archaeon]|nr:GNAT family N-acetyltransferase [Thermoplasmatales archaeon]MCW6169852.1 GNAT family N-acetyltransferase [Thermoplasmatales archaeon]